MDRHILVIAVVVVVAFFAALLLAPKVVFPRRIATPKRVASELAALK
jgi:hypothetical protein